MFCFLLLTCRAGRLTLNQALDLITYLKSETHNVPLLQGIGYLESFYKMIEKRNIADVTQNLKVFYHRMSEVFNKLFTYYCICVANRPHCQVGISTSALTLNKLM